MKSLRLQMHKQVANNPNSQTSASPDYSILSPALHKYQKDNPPPSMPRFQLTAPRLKLTPEGHVSPQMLVQALGGPVNISCDPATFLEQIRELKKIKAELEQAVKEEESAKKESSSEENAPQSQPLPRRRNPEQENVDNTELSLEST